MVIRAIGFAAVVFLGIAPDALAKVSDCVSIAAFGATQDQDDNATAVVSAIEAAVADGATFACVAMPVGKFRLGSKISYTLPAGLSLTLKGAGKGVSFLTWTQGDGGLSLTKSSCRSSIHIEGISFTTQLAAGGTAISVNGACSNGTYQTGNTITNVETRGDDGRAQTYYWSVNLALVADSWWDIHTLTIIGPRGSAESGGFADASNGGVGVSLTGSSNPIGVVFNFVGLQCSMISSCMKYGNNIQGVTVSGGSNFTGCYDGIIGQPGGAGVENSQLTIIGNQFTCYHAQIEDLIGIPFVLVSDNLFINSTAATAIKLDKYCHTSIKDNMFVPVAGGNSTGVYWGSPCANGSGSSNGNFYVALATGVGVSPDASGILIGNNEQFVSDATPIQMDASNPFVKNIRVSAAPGGYGQFQILDAFPYEGTNLIELTVTSTAGLIAGQYLFCNGVGSTGLIGVFPVSWVIDGAHVVLGATAYSNTLTGACFLTP